MPDVPFYDLRPAGDDRRNRLHGVLDSLIDGGYFVGGAPVANFEREFADFLGVKECVGMGNGLDALRIGLETLGIGVGDEVIVPAFTFYASWLAVLQTGATPVPVDVAIDTASIDSAAAAAAITPRTKAIMVVHLYGIPADLATLRRLADDAGIALIEDAAQSHGAKAAGVMTGSVGDFAAFSFYPTKNLGALGDGGMLATDSPEIAAIARRRRSYGQGGSKYEHVDTGWNSRLDSLQAAFLADALPELNSQNERRRHIADAYLGALKSESSSVVGSSRSAECVWHQFVLRTADRDRARVFLANEGISTDVHYPYYFNEVEPLQRYVTSASLSHSKALSAQVLSLPISPWLSDAEVSQVAEALTAMPRELIAGYAGR